MIGFSENSYSEHCVEAHLKCQIILILNFYLLISAIIL